MVEIKYSCIATPPDGISAEKKYLFGHDSKGYFYADNKDKHYSDIPGERRRFLCEAVEHGYSVGR